jgi:hypothetical protein
LHVTSTNAAVAITININGQVLTPWASGSFIQIYLMLRIF